VRDGELAPGAMSSSRKHLLRPLPGDRHAAYEAYEVCTSERSRRDLTYPESWHWSSDSSSPSGNRESPKRTFAMDRLWPGPDVRERQVFGVSMRTAGFRQGNRKVRDPQSTQTEVPGNEFAARKQTLNVGVERQTPPCR
jgi:hypothetical protein